MPPLVLRRLDIHLAEKVDEGELLVSILVDPTSDRLCRDDDILESMIGGASLGGDGIERVRVREEMRRSEGVLSFSGTRRPEEKYS
jgi:hypothetical protein